MHSRNRPTVFVGAMLAVAIIVGCSEKPAPVAPAPPKVTVQTPEPRELIDYDDYNGWMEAVQTVEVRARVRGHLEKIHFTDGQMVEAGQLLFVLDPRPFQAEIDRAKSQTNIYEAQKVAADKEADRLQRLLTKGGASQSQVDKAVADAAALAAQIVAAQEEVRRLALDLEYSRITAPIAGRISRAQITEGNLVNAGGADPLLTTIVSIDPIYIYFNIDERSLQRYQKERPVDADASQGSLLEARKITIKFRRETDEGYPYEAMLDFADNQVDRATGTVQVRGVVPNPTGLFVPGSQTLIRVPVSKPYQAMLIPDTAVLSDQDKKYLLVLDEKNVVQRRDVNLGKLLDDGMRVVLPSSEQGKGIKADDRVIVLGLQSARINYPVDPVPAAPPADAGQ